MADDELQGTTSPQDADTGAAAPPDPDPGAAPAKKAPAKRSRKKAVAAPDAVADATTDPAPSEDADADAPAKKAPAKKAAAKRAPAKKAAAKKTAASKAAEPEPADAPANTETSTDTEPTTDAASAASAAPAVLFQVPQTTATRAPTRRRTTTKVAAAPAPTPEPAADEVAPAVEPAEPAVEATAEAPAPEDKPKRTRTRSGAKGKGKSKKAAETDSADVTDGTEDEKPAEAVDETSIAELGSDDVVPEPEVAAVTVEETETETPTETVETDAEDSDESDDDSDESDDSDDSDDNDESGGGDGNRRRRRRGGRRRRRGSSGGSGSGNGSDDTGDTADSSSTETIGTEAGDEAPAAGTSGRSRGGNGNGNNNGNNGPADDDAAGEAGEGSTRRRRRRRREGDSDAGGQDDGGNGGGNTVTRVRRGRTAEDEITSISGSTRLEAKKQRRREGRDAGRRRAPIVSEAEFLARRESVDRVMAIRQRDDVTQIAVLEDKVLVEHYVARESQTSMIGNVYLGRVQNVLPSMEAAFIDIGKGRNAVLYAGEVNWQALGHKEGSPRKIESVLSSGQTILVQVSKDPIGHKGARLTSQVSLPGRFLVYVPDGTTSGISRKLPDTERNRLKTLLKQIVPDTAGVIVRTAAEGASEDELTTDVERLKARWEDIEAKISRGNAPQLLYGEPDLTLKVVRDLFTEDFASLVIQGDDAWETVQQYVAHVAPDLEERLDRYDPSEHQGRDLFATHRVDEQIAKAMDRKVFLPSGGSLVIDRTEAMTVVDVNTGKFTGSGGNLEETVTKNNLEAAEEVVRQLRLRDIGGIIVVDFIDMVLESNRDLVLRRMVECLGRDRTRHQVAEVTSLGLVQMTRKRIGTGLLESFSESCAHCHGSGVVVHEQPVEPRTSEDDGGRRGGGNGGNGGNGGGANGGGTSRRRGGRGRGQDDDRSGQDDGGRSGQGTGNGNGNGGGNGGQRRPTPAEFAAMAAAKHHDEEQDAAAAAAAVTPTLDDAPAAEATKPAPATGALESAGAAEPTPEVASDTTPETTSDSTPEPTPEPTAPRVSTRRRRGASRPAVTATPATAAEPETPAAEVPAPAEPQAPEAPAAETPEAAPEPAAPVSTGPRLVTRTRRGVSRTAVTAAAAAPTTAPEPAAAPAEDAPAAPPAAAAPPKVVTRTRGRSASRVAGPPADEATTAAQDDVPAGPRYSATGEVASDGVVEPIDVDVTSGDPADPVDPDDSTS